MKPERAVAIWLLTCWSVSIAGYLLTGHFWWVLGVHVSLVVPLVCAIAMVAFGWKWPTSPADATKEAP